MRILVYIALLMFTSLLCKAQNDKLAFYHPDSLNPFEVYEIIVPQAVSEGKVETRHVETNRIAEEYFLKKGKKYGTYRAYDTEGILRVFTVYSADKINGEWSYYNEKQQLAIKGEYLMGEKHGYWTFIAEDCRGRYSHDQRHGKWKCFENGLLKSRVFYHHGELLNNKQEKKEKKLSDKDDVKPNSTNTAIQANMVMNPRFRQNIYEGQEVYILGYKAKSMDEKVQGKIKTIVSKKSFDGRGIKVVLENGEEGRVVEFIDLPPGQEKPK